MRRRRRNRGTWLQTLGSLLDEGSPSTFNGIAWQQPVDPTQFITTIVPVTTDAPSFQGDSVNSATVMGDVIGNEYFLDRVVGKIFLQTSAGTTIAPESAQFLYPVLVACGLFVARADDLDNTTPIGGALGAESERHYSPLEADTVREPWIWRRAWMLGNAGNTYVNGADNEGIPPQGSTPAGAFPNSNAFYGSVLDGPHIDAKTKRRVGQEDRLWFACSASYVPGFGRPGTESIEENQSINGYFDLRLHGALRRARQSGRF